MITEYTIQEKRKIGTTIVPESQNHRTEHQTE